MTELLVTFTEPTRTALGALYYARALGEQAKDGRWHAHIEFVLDGDEAASLTGDETVQSSRGDLEYWAQGLSPTYLEGALARALWPVTTAVAHKLSRLSA